MRPFSDEEVIGAVFCNRGIAELKYGMVKRALEDFETVKKLSPRLELAYYNSGLSKKILKRYKEAADDFRYALKLDPNLEDAKKELTLIEDYLKN